MSPPRRALAYLTRTPTRPRPHVAGTMSARASRRHPRWCLSGHGWGHAKRSAVCFGSSLMVLSARRCVTITDCPGDQTMSTTLSRDAFASRCSRPVLRREAASGALLQAATRGVLTSSPRRTFDSTRSRSRARSLALAKKRFAQLGRTNSRRTSDSWSPTRGRWAKEARTRSNFAATPRHRGSLDSAAPAAPDRRRSAQVRERRTRSRSATPDSASGSGSTGAFSTA